MQSLGHLRETRLRCCCGGMRKSFSTLMHNANLHLLLLASLENPIQSSLAHEPDRRVVRAKTQPCMVTCTTKVYVCYDVD